MQNIIFTANEENIAKAANRLKNGELVVMPTETVYGLGANATLDNAVAKIFEAKRRPQFNPLIVHFADITDAEPYVEFNDKALKIAEKLCPGSITMILPRKKDANISLLCSAGLPTLAIRIPNHQIARELIKQAGVPISAPSANRSGTLSPTSATHVFESLGIDAGMILDAGETTVGLESTVIDITQEIPTILRPGFITAADLEPIIGKVNTEIKAVDSNPKSPGQLLKHYAPKTPIRLNATEVDADEALLGFGKVDFAHNDKYLNLSESGDLVEAASNVFAMLHKLDNMESLRIAVMPIPNEGLGLAINDRLSRASGKY